MSIEKAIFNRARLLVGDNAMERIGDARVIIFGVGGVGSWLAESLVRSGVRHLTIVDSDRVCITNVNRQLMATMDTIGKVKVEALKDRLLSINPIAEIEARQQIFCADTASSFNLNDYDYVVDCIDSLKDKLLLIELATASTAKFYSSMGAALKINPLRIRVAEFWKVNGCPLARILRKRIRKYKVPVRKKFLCVYSDEVLENKGHETACGSERCLCPKNPDPEGDPDLANHEWCSSKAQINGTLMHITAIFGLILSGLILQDLAD